MCLLLALALMVPGNMGDYRGLLAHPLAYMNFENSYHFEIPESTNHHVELNQRRGGD